LKHTWVAMPTARCPSHVLLIPIVKEHFPNGSWVPPTLCFVCPPAATGVVAHSWNPRCSGGVDRVQAILGKRKETSSNTN
jgi:hypothetical protein